MREIIFIISIIFLSCNAKQSIETKPADLTVIARPTANYTPRPLTSTQKIKEIRKLCSIKEFVFDNWLIFVQDKDSIIRFRSQLDTLYKTFTTTKTKAPFDSTNTWKLNAYVTKGWDSHMPLQKKDYYGCYLAKASTHSLSGSDIFEIFGLSAKKFPLNAVPIVWGRNAPFNGEWTASLGNEDHLIVCRVHSYPDGNQTSWYHEQVYYFEKLNSFRNKF